MMRHKTGWKGKIPAMVLSMVLLAGMLPVSVMHVMAASKNEDGAEYFDTNTIVVDDKNPDVKISCQAVGKNPVTGEAASLKAKVEKDTDVIRRNPVSDVDENTRLIYNGAVAAEIEIQEANFLADDVSVSVKRDGTELGPEEMSGCLSPWRTDEEKDRTLCEAILAEDGDYEITVAYTDKSEKDMMDSSDEFQGEPSQKFYTSNVITVDTVKPVVEVSYIGGNARNIHYYDTDRTATIRITDRNFRPDEILVNISAVDVQDQEISFEHSDLLSWIDWIQDSEDENSWIAKIPFHMDAAYTVDIVCKDLAGNEADPYETDHFVIDKEAPDSAGMTISYADQVKDWKDPLHYFSYQDSVTIMLTSEDDISGIDSVTWIYQQESGTSTEKNVAGRSQTIERKDMTFSNEGKRATASFSLTAAEAEQFRGNISFTATDMAGNTSDIKRDENRVNIVDNISPTRIVSYSPAKRVVDAATLLTKSSYTYEEENTNSILYYDGNVTVTFKIAEANFYAEDVVINVNGVRQKPSDWKQNGDEWTGTVILSHDGEYQVTMDYADRSTNRMKSYVSEKIVIDTEKPTISVSNIRANSANKDEKYGFTITASDTADHLDAETFLPVLTAVTQNESGAYEKKEIALGDISVDESNQIYSVSVDNLPEDAVYTLSCKVKDMADNECKMMMLEDGKEYESVSFSINRRGSAFFADADTEFLAQQYYVYSVKNDIVIHEINVDPIEHYAVKLNGTELKEGKDYKTFISSRDGEWSKRTYDVKKSLFEKEGDYDIVIESVDKAKTASYSDIKNLKISCVVDQTAPIVAISGLKENGRYQTEEQTVTAIPTDDGGKLRSFKAVVFDKNGEPLKDKEGKDISTRIELVKDELDTYLARNDGKVSFTIPKGTDHQVQIVCDDYALHPDGVSTNKSDEIFSGVTVSRDHVTVTNVDDTNPHRTIPWIIMMIGAEVVITILAWRKKML